MKRFITIASAAVFAVVLSSCKSKEEDTAQKTVDRYVIFVDSVNKLKPQQRDARWERIMEDYSRKRSEAEAAVEAFTPEEQKKEQERIANSNSIFEGVQALAK